MFSPSQRWLSLSIVLIACLTRTVDAQPVWQPVGSGDAGQRGDSLANGALVGFLVGAGLALNRLGSCEMNCYVAFVPVFGGIGAGIGTLVDATKRHTTLYLGSDRPSR